MWHYIDPANTWFRVYPGLSGASVFHPHVLSIAHKSLWSGHLGANKTYKSVLKYFFWPGLKSDVVKFCRSCHVCQVVRKPNQKIHPAPLHPIPAIGEPFERVILDCIGPLPRTRTGNQYLLTIMWAATRYPEAVPLCKITSSSIDKALTRFFSTFGLPRIIQNDQGTNFQSQLFKYVLNTFDIKHSVFSPYHPESQGAMAPDFKVYDAKILSRLQEKLGRKSSFCIVCRCFCCQGIFRL